jgi:hypothetical protein
MTLPVEKSVVADDSDSEIDQEYNVKLDGGRLREIIARRTREEEDQAKKRRAGRPRGELTDSLIEKLRACNVAQLKTVKQRCNKYIQDHRKPPSRHDCRKPFAVKVLQAVTVKNVRYQLEFQRTSLRGKKVYLYIRVCAYWRDGRIIKLKTIKQDKYFRRSLPKKVWIAFRDYFNNAEIENLRQALLEQIRSTHEG